MSNVERANVTIVLPVSLLRAVKHQAVDANLSLSSYIARLLAESVAQREEYDLARQRQFALMAEGFDLQFDHARWNREDLHDR